MKILQAFKSIFKKPEIDIQALHHEVNNTLIEKELKRIHAAIDIELDLIRKLEERVGLKL